MMSRKNSGSLKAVFNLMKFGTAAAFSGFMLTLLSGNPDLPNPEVTPKDLTLEDNFKLSVDFGNHVVTGLDDDASKKLIRSLPKAEGEWHGKDRIPYHVYISLVQASYVVSVVPLLFKTRLLAAESGFDANAVNNKSKAAGATQLVPETAMELLHKFGHDHGYGEHVAMIERTSKKGKDGRNIFSYALKDKRDLPKLLDLCKDVKFSTLMTARNIAQKIGVMEKELGIENATYFLGYMAHFAGPTRAKEIYHAVNSPARLKKPAADLFTKKQVNRNNSIFFNRIEMPYKGKGPKPKNYKAQFRKAPKTLKEFVDFMASKGFDDTPLPAMKDWRMKPGNFHLVVEGKTYNFALN